MKNKFAISELFLFFLLLVNLSGCVKKSTIYYPLKEGMIWEYQTSMNAKVTVTNFATRELKGRKVTPQKIMDMDILGQSYFSFIAEDNKGIYEFAT